MFKIPSLSPLLSVIVDFVILLYPKPFSSIVQIPKIEQVLPALPLLLIFMALLVLPGTYASLWGPKYLSPGIVGLLFMTEIIVGAISVALLAGEPFGIRELMGVLLIAGASMLEPLLALRGSDTNSA